MELFLDILYQITLPIIAVTGLGYLAQRRLGLHVPSLNQLLVYVVLPAFLLHYLASSTAPLADVGWTAVFTVAQFVVLVALAWGASALLRVPPPARPVLGLTAALPNSGNYGIPLIELAFGREFILHQAVIVSLHSILITSVGVVLLASRSVDRGKALRAVLRAPLIPAVLAGVALNVLGVGLPMPVAFPMKVLGSAYTPLALFTLGAQLANAQGRAAPGTVTLAMALKFGLAPAATAVALWFLPVSSGLADVLIVGASAPVGVLLAILCTELKREEDLASAAVFLSTVLSPVIVTATIFAIRAW